MQIESKLWRLAALATTRDLLLVEFEPHKPVFRFRSASPVKTMLASWLSQDNTNIHTNYIEMFYMNKQLARCLLASMHKAAKNKQTSHRFPARWHFQSLKRRLGWNKKNTN